MTLRLDLKPYEGFLINGALIRNGGRRANIAIETQCKFLRESEVIKDSEADTPAKKLCVTLQVLYLADDPAEVEGLFQSQALELLRSTPSTAPFLLAIYEEITAGRPYQALKRGRDLLQYESSLMDVESGRAPGLETRGARHPAA